MAGTPSRFLDIAFANPAELAKYQPGAVNRQDLYQKICAGADIDTTLFHWRDRAGAEVDLVLEANDGRVVGIEIKAGQTPNLDWFRWLARMRDSLGEQFVAGIVLYGGDHVLPFGDRLLAVPIPALWQV